MIQHIESQLRDLAAKFDALGIDGSDQLRDWADRLVVGKVTPNRAMSLVCRANMDVYHATGGVA